MNLFIVVEKRKRKRKKKKRETLRFSVEEDRVSGVWDKSKREREKMVAKMWGYYSDSGITCNSRGVVIKYESI